jgi:ribose transport system ATP-binding protein
VTASPALLLRGVTKTFPGQVALDGVDFEVRRGEIHALIGQNGSGKSTLIKVLSGYHRPDPGCEAELAGEPLNLGGHRVSGQQQMKFMHQDVALIDDLTVYENLFLDEVNDGAFHPLSPKSQKRRAVEILRKLGWVLDVNLRLADLTPSEREAVALAKAVGVGAPPVLLVLDEPTVAAGASEVRQMFAVLRRLRDEGVGIIYVSHVLEEVLELADRITVLRDGRIVGTFTAADTNERALISTMIGRNVEEVHLTPTALSGDVVMRVEHMNAPYLDDVSFGIGRGEIVGITGLQGSGYEMVPHYLVGSRSWTSGRIDFGDQGSVEHPRPKTCLKHGLAMMPSDRRSLGLIPQFTIRENISLPDFTPVAGRFAISRRSEHHDVEHWTQMVRLRPPECERRVDELSGGNQQKVMLAKWLRCKPSVLILDEPSQGVDVGAKAVIEQMILDLAAEGKGLLIASNEAGDLARLCHRVLIFREGRIAVELSGDDLSEHRILSETLATDTRLDLAFT